MNPYRILCLDGGGIRGIFTAILLERLNKQKGLAGWLGSVDLIAGTSTGGLLALALAHGLGPEQIRNLYEEKGDEIFDDSWLDDLVDLGRISGADYSIRKIEKDLKKVFAWSMANCKYCSQ